MDPILRREYEPAALLAAHPPQLRHPHKQLAFDLAYPKGATHSGRIVVSRWPALKLPSTMNEGNLEVEAVPGFFVYGDDAAVWHVNFADPRLFVGYGSALLAQDELQALEHPLLGSLREALLADGQRALTEDDDAPTPVLVRGVERRCTLSTTPDATAGRPHGLYGNRFAAASADVVRRAITVLNPPTHSNLIAIAAPSGGQGPYGRKQLERILVTAVTGFSAAIEESALAWPGAPVEIRTGFWGCGAFGGNRYAMTLLQLLAARLAQVSRLRFYAADESGLDAFTRGSSDLDNVAPRSGEPIAAVIDRIEALGYTWGVSDGN